MIRSKRKEKNSSYHDSFYQYKRRPPVIKYCLLTALVILCALAALKVNASESPIKKYPTRTGQNFITLDEVGGGQLLLSGGEPTRNQRASNHPPLSGYQVASILNSEVSFDIKGLIATVTFTQSFVNPSSEPLNGLYAFPLPDKSAVNHLSVQIGQRLIEGKIMEKEQAKRIFSIAQQTGKRASLVQQHRPNLFTNHIANIGAHEQVTVTLTYVQHVQYDQGRFQLRFPMNITPRYMPQRQSRSQLSQLLLAPSLEQTIHTDRNITIRATLNAGIPLSKIESRSHQINLTPAPQTRFNNISSSKLMTELDEYQVSLNKIMVPMDKDFHLMWQPKASATPQVSLFTQMLNGEQYALAMLIPATNHNEGVRQKSSFSRDVTFIIDTSGSMQGESIKQAKQSLLFALKTLTPKDTFNIISFASNHQSLFENSVLSTPENINQARNFIQQLNANGGTEMYQPLASALAMKTSEVQNVEAVRQVIFITDGAVSNELELFQLIERSANLPRIFTVGIGSAPNGYFMRKAAQFGKGSYTYISDLADIEPIMSELLDKISRPALRNINIQFQPLHLGSIEQYPKKIPDLYYGEPLMVAFKTALTPSSMQVFGDQVNQGWHQELMFTNQQKSQGITSIWARNKIEDLMDGLVLGKSEMSIKPQVLSTSLLHQVMSPYSSFIAVERSLNDDLLPDDDTQSEQAKRKDNKLLARLNTSLTPTPLPQTALGWKLKFSIGLLIFCLGVFFNSRRTH